jgi:hypothetical protein
VKRSVLLAPLCLGALASSAFAAAVSIKANLSETADASDNYFLSHSPIGYTAKSLSAINLHTLAATPTTRYLLDSNFSYFKYLGPGAKDTTLQWGTPLSEKFRIDHSTPLSKYNFAASWSRSDVATTALAQLGKASGRGSTDNYTVVDGVTRELSHLDSLSWTTTGSTVSYSDPRQTPYVDYSSTVSWNHRLTPTTTLTQSLYFDWFFSDDAANTQRLFWKPTTGLQSQLSKRLSVNGAVGWVFVNAYQNANMPTPVSTVFQNLPGVSNAPTIGTEFQPLIGATNGWVGNMGLNYKLFSDTQVGFTATRAITPTIFGQLHQIESIGSTLKYNINHSSDLAIFTQFSRTKSGQTATTAATASEFFTASANYSYTLTREWRTNLTYTYRQRNDQTGHVRANSILFRLVGDFTLFGQPPTIVKTPSELAQEDLARAQLVFPGLLAP